MSQLLRDVFLAAIVLISPFALADTPARKPTQIFSFNDFTIPHHWHTSPERIVLVSGQLEITYDGQQAAVLKPGMYAYSPAKLSHTAICANGDPCILFISYDGPIDAFATVRPAQ